MVRVAATLSSTFSSKKSVSADKGNGTRVCRSGAGVKWVADTLVKIDDKNNCLSVEGGNRQTRHRHVTVTPSKYQIDDVGSNVTKIEVELQEAPDEAILVGPVPSELDTSDEINSTYPDGLPVPGTIVVRAEEVLIVVLVLVLWVAAIALFFNRWGKIRMLEPYQPKFQQQHRQSCAMVDQNVLQPRTYSKFNIHCLEHPVHQTSCGSAGLVRPRQNSVFVGSSASLLPPCQEAPRRAKSALDLQSVVAECTVQNPTEEFEDTIKMLRPPIEWKLPLKDRRVSACQFERMDTLSRPVQRERGMSICQFDRTDILNKPLQRDRGMSICHFDRMDVLARPLQRDRGMSICHFDRTDVLARPLLRDRGSTFHFDRMDVLARPIKPLPRERRVSMFNFIEKVEETNRNTQKRLSYGNVDRIESFGSRNAQLNVQKDYREGTMSVDRQDTFVKNVQKDRNNTVYHYDRPSCSKTPDVVLGYKATCV